MPARSGHIRLSTQGDGDVAPLSDRIIEIVRDAGVERGVATVFVPGATAAVTTMEFEPAGPRPEGALDRLIPPRALRAQPAELRLQLARAYPRGDRRAVGVDPDRRRLMLGTWQDRLIDFDDRPRANRARHGLS